MQNMQTLVSGSTTFGQLYALLNNNMTTLASQFSGSTFPANPTTGQPCYRTDKNPPVWYIFNGTTWEDGAMASAIVTALLAETQKARGTAATLDARLDVALNADGTLKAPTPAGGWWTQETGAIARVSASSFSVAGDRRQIYTALRAVRLAQNTDADSHVVSCSYAAESDLTIVTIDDSVVDVGITTVFYGIDVASTPDFSSNADLTQVKAITDLVTDVPTAGGIPQADANGKLAAGWINQYTPTSMLCNVREVITTSKTWAAPVTGWYKVTCIGGGGAGGNGRSDGVYNNCGGNSGEEVVAYLYRIKGTTEAITIGAGGIGIISPSYSGGDGGNTSFGNLDADDFNPPVLTGA